MKLLAIAALALISTPAIAATQIVVGGVTVGSNIYDVSFGDGTCASFFGSCQLSNFAFNTLNTAAEAARSLQDQVFLDTDLGNFDSNPSLTLGCVSADPCRAATPYAVTVRNGAVSNVQYFYSVNYIENGRDGVGNGGNLAVANDFANTADLTLAKFTYVGPAVVAAVPEPATWAMMLVGVGAIGGAARYRRRKINVAFA